MNDLLQFAAAAQDLPDRTGRLAGLYRRAENRPLRIAAFGGSVTFGYHAAKPEENLISYPELLCGMLPCRTELHNYAASGTNAWFGLYLAAMAQDSLRPDLVILEYAVNQGVSRAHVTAYESLLYRLSTLPSAPAAVHVMCVNERGESSAGVLTHLAAHYGQAAVSVQKGLCGTAWQDYAEDHVHPHQDGQRLLAAAVYEAISRAEAANANAIPQPCLDRSAAGLYLLDTAAGAGSRACIPFPGLLSEAPAVLLHDGETYSVTAEGDAFLLIYRQSCYADTNDAIFTIDDESPLRLQAYLQAGWGNPYVQRVIPAQKRESHTLTLQHAGGAGRFVLWGIAAYRIRKEDTR